MQHDAHLNKWDVVIYSKILTPCSISILINISSWALWDENDQESTASQSDEVALGIQTLLLLLLDHTL